MKERLVFIFILHFRPEWLLVALLMQHAAAARTYASLELYTPYCTSPEN